MVRDFLNFIVQKKYLVMFITSLIYILGLFAFFSDTGVIFGSLLLVVSLFMIIKNYLSPKVVLFWYFVFFFAFFNASLRIKNSDELFQIAPQEATIEGQIVSIPQSDALKQKFFVQVSKLSYFDKVQNIDSKTLVTVYATNGAKERFNIGDFYTFKGKLRVPTEATNPSQFNYRQYLKNFGVFSVFYANEDDCAHVDKTPNFKWRFLQGLNNVRNDIIASHAKYLKSPNLEILGGIVFGDDAVSPPDYIKASFANSGLLHILAASGMNVALIYGIWFFILRRLRAPFNLTVASGIFVVIFYAMMTGLGASVLRATFMLVFVLIGKLMDRDAHSVSLLSFVALLMLIYNPAFINDVGFQLSFMVTFGLLIMTPFVFENFCPPSQHSSAQAPLLNPPPQVGRRNNKSEFESGERRGYLPAWLAGAIFIPLIAQIWVAPIQMYYFNSFSLYSVFANILAVPLLTVISFGGFVSSVLAIIKPISGVVCFVFDFVLNPILNLLVIISDYFSSLPHSLIQMPQPTTFQIFLYYLIVLLIALMFKMGKDRRVILSVFALLIILLFSGIKLPNKNFETIFFDVGNADAILIKTPQEKYFIIDTGKAPFKHGKSQARMIILSYLKDKGIKNIQGLIITHFDSDHAGGAVDLIENLNINNIYVNTLSDKSKIAQAIYEVAKAKNIQINATQNNEIIFKSGTFSIRNFRSKINDDNENSIITLISEGEFDELFMGDAGILAFEKIKQYLPKRVEVLKVGHHGAKNVLDKLFLDRINPEVAVISTGINNYGHPNGVTLELLERKNVRVFRTDRKNSVKIVKTFADYEIFTYVKNNYVVNFVKNFS